MGCVGMTLNLQKSLMYVTILEKRSEFLLYLLHICDILSFQSSLSTASLEILSSKSLGNKFHVIHSEKYPLIFVSCYSDECNAW